MEGKSRRLVCHIPAVADNVKYYNGSERITLNKVKGSYEDHYLLVFTSRERFKACNETAGVVMFIREAFYLLTKVEGVDGIVLNIGNEEMILNKNYMELINKIRRLRGVVREQGEELLELKELFWRMVRELVGEDYSPDYSILLVSGGNQHQREFLQKLIEEHILEGWCVVRDPDTQVHPYSSCYREELRYRESKSYEEIQEINEKGVIHAYKVSMKIISIERRIMRRLHNE